jgi:hypothetical protein
MDNMGTRDTHSRATHGLTTDASQSGYDPPRRLQGGVTVRP